MAEQLKKIYDDDSSEKPITRPDLRVLEGGGETSEPKGGHLKDVTDGEEAKSLSPEALKTAEESGDSTPTDQLGAGYSANDTPKSGRSFRPNVRSLLKNKTLLIGGGGGIATLIVVGFSLFGFLNVFKLDHFLQNIDTKTMSRFNASFSGRSDTYTRAYVRLRMMQIDGAVPTDPNSNLYFRAHKVDTNNPTFDWYKTMYTSNFEKDLLEKNGIAFTSVAVPKEGGGFTLRAAKITLKDESIGFDPQKELPDATYKNLTSGDPTRLSTALNQLSLPGGLGNTMDNFVDAQIFNSDKAARKEIKTVVRDNTHFFQVVRRRRLRKNIQNMIGVRSWSFFETSLVKYQEKKTDIQRKILQKALPGDGQIASFMQCIFVGDCSVKNDPANTVGSSENLGIDTPNPDDNTDAQGKPTTKDVPPNLGGSELAQQAEQAVASEAQAVDQAATSSSTITQRIVQKIVANFTNEAVGDTASAATGNVTKWWQLAKKFAKIDGAVRNGTFSKMVKAAKLSAYIGFATTLATARDQMKTGEVSADEVQSLMGTIDGFDNSEGWQQVTNSSSSGVVSAAALDDSTRTSTSKAEYCSPGHQKQPNEFAWFCDGQKPNSGGTAGTFENAYNSSVGYILHPIAAAVNGIHKIPIIGSLIDFATNLTSSVTGFITDATIKPILEATGVTKGIGSLLKFGMEKLLVFSGAVPDFSQPGKANFALAGSAGIAEGSARLAGGVASTPKTLSYTNGEAVAYLNEQNKNRSLFERYASLNNPDSLGAKTTFAVANTSIPKVVGSLASSFTKLPALFGDLFTGRLFAQTTQPASTLASFAGVDTYDIPQQCQDLDPLSPNYLQQAVGVEQSSQYAKQASDALNAVLPSLSIDTVRDENAFWKVVYDKIGKDSKDAEAIAGAIYNCALLDKQVEGGLGYLYGYTNDGGLGN